MCDYLSMLGLKLNYVSKRGHRFVYHLGGLIPTKYLSVFQFDGNYPNHISSLSSWLDSILPQGLWASTCYMYGLQELIEMFYPCIFTVTVVYSTQRYLNAVYYFWCPIVGDEGSSACDVDIIWCIRAKHYSVHWHRITPLLYKSIW